MIGVFLLCQLYADFNVCHFVARESFARLRTVMLFGSGGSCFVLFCSSFNDFKCYRYSSLGQTIHFITLVSSSLEKRAGIERRIVDHAEHNPYLQAEFEMLLPHNSIGPTVSAC